MSITAGYPLKPIKMDDGSTVIVRRIDIAHHLEHTMGARTVHGIPAPSVTAEIEIWNPKSLDSITDIFTGASMRIMKMIVRCNHCKSWAARHTNCKHCGAPIEDE